MKSSAYPSFYRQPPYMDYPLPPPFLQEMLISPFYDFSKIPTRAPPLHKSGRGGSHYVDPGSFVSCYVIHKPLLSFVTLLNEFFIPADLHEDYVIIEWLFSCFTNSYILT